MPSDVLAYLARDDKRIVAGGRSSAMADGVLSHPDAPGFWEAAYVASRVHDHLFTYLLVDENGRDLPLRVVSRHWRPDRCTRVFHAPDLSVTEQKVIVFGDVFACRVEIRNTGGRDRQLTLIQWMIARNDRIKHYRQSRFVSATAGEGTATVTLCGPDRDDMRGNPRSVVLLGADRPAGSWDIVAVEDDYTDPTWIHSCLGERFSSGRLGNEATGLGETGRNIHIYLAYPLMLRASEVSAITLGASVGIEPQDATPLAVLQEDVIVRSEMSWRAFFDQVPRFTCDNPYLDRYYWYRWFGLRAHAVDVGDSGLPYPCVMEGIGGFRAHIAYSAQCHMLEMRWLHDPRYAEGSLLNFLDQMTCGEDIPGHLWVGSGPESAGWLDVLNPNGERYYHTYHANWGANVLAVYAVTGNLEFLRRTYAPLGRYVEAMGRKRDVRGSNLYDILTHWETGQEFSSRYQVFGNAGETGGRIQLKGVDLCTYMADTCRALAVMAGLLDRPADERVAWRAKAEAIGAAIRRYMWDPTAGMFVDCHSETLERSPYRAAVGFYPFFADVAGPEHLRALHDQLLNPAAFWTPWPVPTSPIDDPFFDAQARWRGVRHSCPWNGRVWPMTNSHVCDALARAARTLDPTLREAAGTLVRKFVELMFFDHDPARPNCFEHYNPFTGQACEYRGVDDYQHSWVVDLILKHVVGLLPQVNGTVVVDPLPVGLTSFEVDRVLIRGRTLAVRYNTQEGLMVERDGQCVGHAQDGQPVIVNL